MAPAGVRIARATPADLDDAARLFDAYRVFYRQPGDPAGAREFIAARLRDGDSVILLARLADGAAAGFVQLYPSYSSVSMRRIWILNDLYVDAAARRHGVGAALMAEAEAFARATGAGRLELTTERINTTAQRLYAASGYELDQVFLKFTRTLD